MPFPQNPAGSCDTPTPVVPPVITPVYCASIAMPGGGYLFHPADARDPAATIAVTDCSATPNVIGYAYPAAGPGHTVAVEGCTGGVVGYIPNCSDCACKAPEPTTITITQPPIVVTGTGEAVVTATANGYNVHVDAPPPPVVDINVSNLALDAAGNLVLTETDGSTHQVNIPQPTPVVVTGTNAANVTATATGFNVDVVIPAPVVDINVSNLTLDAAGNLLLTETDGSTHQVTIPAPTPVVVTGTNAANVTPTATGFNVDVVIPEDVDCPPAGAAATAMCHGDQFVGRDPATCEPKLFSLPGCAPVLPASTAAGQVTLTSGQYETAASAGNNTPIPVAEPVGYTSGSAAPSTSISFNAAAGESYLVQFEADDYNSAGPIAVSFGTATNATYTVIDQRDVSTPDNFLTTAFSLLLVKATASGTVDIPASITGTALHSLYNVTHLAGADPSNPIGTVGYAEFNNNNSPLLVTNYQGGGASYSAYAVPTRGGIAPAVPMTTLVSSRHVFGADPTTGASTSIPPAINNAIFVSPGISTLDSTNYQPYPGWLPNSSLNVIESFNETYSCPLAMAALANPPDGVMTLGRDSTGHGVVYYVPLNAAPAGSGGTILSEQQVSVIASTDAAGCCCPTRAVVDVRAGTIETTMAQGNIIKFTSTLNGIASTVTVAHTGVGVTSISTPIPLVSDYPTALCGTATNITGSLTLESVAFVNNTANEITTNFGVRGVTL
jgi:hypothetical protein